MAQLSTTATFYRSGRTPYQWHTGYDGAPCVARYAFRTDVHGATELSFRTERMVPDPSAGHDKPDTLGNFRWILTEEPTGYESYCGLAGWPCQAVYNGSLSGSRSLSLLPEKDYYLWIFPQDSTYCLWRIDGARVTTAGEYGQPSAVTAEDGVFGEPLPIQLSRRLPSAVHTVTVDCLGIRETLMEQGSLYPTVDWATSLADWAPRLPEAASAQARIRVESFCNGNSLGSAETTITMRIPEGALQAALGEGWATLTPENPGAAAAFDCWIAGVSRARATFDATLVDPAPLLGASIRGFSLEAPGAVADAAPYLSPVLQGPTRLRLSAVDSRGQRSSEYRTVEPLPYAPPELSEIAVQRCDAQGAPDEDGTCLSVRAALSFSGLEGRNSCALTVSVRSLGGSFGAPETLAPGQATILTGCSPDISYEVKIAALDGLGRETVVLRRLATRRWAMKFRPDGQGVAFGKAPERARALELPSNWGLYLGEESLWAWLHPAGSLVLSAAAPGEGTWTDLGTLLPSGGPADAPTVHLWQRTAPAGAE